MLFPKKERERDVVKKREIKDEKNEREGVRNRDRDKERDIERYTVKERDRARKNGSKNLILVSKNPKSYSSMSIV